MHPKRDDPTKYNDQKSPPLKTYRHISHQHYMYIQWRNHLHLGGLYLHRQRLQTGKNYKRVFVYHGTSDKVFTLKDKKLDISWFEYYFLSGPKELYKLKTFSHNSELLDKRIVKIGMFRSDTIIRKESDKEKILKDLERRRGYLRTD